MLARGRRTSNIAIIAFVVDLHTISERLDFFQIVIMAQSPLFSC